MKVKLLQPQGYCAGVTRALTLCQRSLSDPNIAKPIYILGNIIHNKKVVSDLTKQGIISINTPNQTRLQLLDQINHGSVIISAHGASNKVIEKALSKGLNVIDATCIDVLKIQNTILNFINSSTCHYVIYIGILNHPEAEGILGISNKICLFDYNTPLITPEMSSILNNKHNQVLVCNQTTLSVFDIINHYEVIKSNANDNIIIKNEICKATTLRQEAVNSIEDCDLLYVVGDKLSSNSNKLVEIGLKKNIKTILLEKLNDIDLYDLTIATSIGITSGASTPKEITLEIYNFINNFKKSNN